MEFKKRKHLFLKFVVMINLEVGESQLYFLNDINQDHTENNRPLQNQCGFSLRILPVKSP